LSGVPQPYGPRLKAWASHTKSSLAALIGGRGAPGSERGQKNAPQRTPKQSWGCYIVGATRVDLELALTGSRNTESTLHHCVIQQLAGVGRHTAEIILDFTDTSWEVFFKNIVKRSKTLRYITVIASFTCSKCGPTRSGHGDAHHGRHHLWEIDRRNPRRIPRESRAGDASRK
jgi:hypothetical protein